MEVSRCIFCCQKADYECPIGGGSICSTSCHELCIWADEYGKAADVYLEYLPRVKEYCRNKLGLSTDEAIIMICKSCAYHWRCDDK